MAAELGALILAEESLGGCWHVNLHDYDLELLLHWNEWQARVPSSSPGP